MQEFSDGKPKRKRRKRRGAFGNEAIASSSAGEQRGGGVLQPDSPSASESEPLSLSAKQMLEIARQLDGSYYGYKPKWRMDETHEQFSDIEPQVVSTEISRVFEASKHIAHSRAEVLRQKALDDYAQTTFRPEIYPDPPIRGCFGEAKILPKVGIQPAAQRPMRLCGERREALIFEVKMVETEKSISSTSQFWLVVSSICYPKESQGDLERADRFESG